MDKQNVGIVAALSLVGGLMAYTYFSQERKHRSIKTKPIHDGKKQQEPQKASSGDKLEQIDDLMTSQWARDIARPADPPTMSAKARNCGDSVPLSALTDERPSVSGLSETERVLIEGAARDSRIYSHKSCDRPVQEGACTPKVGAFNKSFLSAQTY